MDKLSIPLIRLKSEVYRIMINKSSIIKSMTNFFFPFILDNEQTSYESLVLKNSLLMSDRDCENKYDDSKDFKELTDKIVKDMKDKSHLSIVMVIILILAMLLIVSNLKFIYGGSILADIFITISIFYMIIALLVYPMKIVCLNYTLKTTMSTISEKRTNMRYEWVKSEDECKNNLIHIILSSASLAIISVMIYIVLRFG
jgi:hypothetical protein